MKTLKSDCRHVARLKYLYSNVDCITQIKKVELEYIIGNSSPDIIGLTEIYPKAVFMTWMRALSILRIMTCFKPNRKRTWCYFIHKEKIVG